MGDPEPLLSVVDLRYLYAASPAVDGLSLSIHRGELFGLIGPDGAGKTTAIRTMAGVMKPQGGSVRIGGRDPLDARSGVREILGYMPQRYSLYGDMSVAENLRFFGTLFCLDPGTYRRRADRLLSITRLGPFRDRRADALSGGMYKKLALACSLLHEPELLLMDEPTNGVDPISRAELWDLLYEFVSAGMAVVVSTPYMDEAARCHSVGLLHHGRLLAEGRPSELVGGFADSVWSVPVVSPEVDAVLEAREDAVIGVAPLGSGLRVVARGDGSGIVAALAAIGVDAKPAKPTFEDMFLSRVRAG